MKNYLINPRPVELGGGWILKLYEDGEEMGGGVFPLVTTSADAYSDATEEGQNWTCQTTD